MRTHSPAFAPQVEPCPGCGATSGVQPQPAPPKVQAWTCTKCGLEWVITWVNPHLRPVYPADLGELLRAARRTLRQFIALAEQADTLTDEQLRDRLTTLAEAGNR